MEPEVTNGQAAPADLSETTAPAPGGDGGQSRSPVQTTVKGPDAAATGESFFDPKTIEHSPELLQAYKQMQGNFSKKMSGIRENQQKIDLYNAYQKDPVGTVRQIAQQYGMTIVNGQPQPTEKGQFSPNSWDDVVKHVRDEVRAELTQQYDPLVSEVKNLKQQNIEQYMDNKYVDWRTYESEMIGTLQKHPSMAHDPDTLYRMSVPQELLESRAMEKALAKLKGGADAGAIPGAKQTRITSQKPSGALSFDDAVKFAKSQLQSRGLSGPVRG
jgi:hypothetical protein